MISHLESSVKVIYLLKLHVLLIFNMKILGVCAPPFPKHYWSLGLKTVNLTMSIAVGH